MKHKYLLGIFEDDDVLLNAVRKIKKEGFNIHEIFTPFPVHYLDEAMGLQESRLHTMGFVFGAIGTLFALSAMSYISAVDWPINVGGKPFFNFPSYFPIMFELTVLFASVGMVIVYYIRNGFTIFKDAEIVHPRITDDKFVTVFCMKQYHEKEDLDRITALLKETGATEITEKVLENELEPNAFQADEHDVHLETAHH
jgi:hypothetical protein